MTQTKSHIPKIRFKEFSWDWEEKKLWEVANLTSSKRVYLKDYVKKWIPFYRWKEISELKRNIVPNDILYITEESYNDFKDKYWVPQTNDILITAVWTLWNILRIKNNDKFYFKDWNLIWFRKINESSEFLEVLLDFDKKKILKSSIWSSQKALTIVSLNKLKFNFPQFPEQQKIAWFLSLVDKKIENIKEKKKSFEEYKKGIMQKIFNVGNDGNRSLRFKDENWEEFGEWEEKKVWEIFDNIWWTALEKYVNELWEYNFISIWNYTIDWKYINNSQKIVLNEKTKTKLLEKDNLVMVLNDKTATWDMIGSSILIDKDNKYIYNQRSERLICNENIFPKFIWFYLNSKDFRKRLFAVSQWWTQIYVNFPAVKKLKLLLPSLPEQQKIADFLSGIDEKIESVNSELVKVKEFKKGLLQGMFV